MGYRKWSIKKDFEYMEKHGGKIKNYSRLMNFKFKWKYSIPIMWLYGFRKRKTNDKNDIETDLTLTEKLLIVAPWIFVILAFIVLVKVILTFLEI